jgi:ligand-binding sensor protein/AraC-like DNA-binding protein
MRSAIITPEDEGTKIIQNIVEDFACATDFASVIVDIHGEETSTPYHFSPFCKLMRQSKEFHALCQKCDMYGGLEAAKTGQPSIYQCHAGLIDVSLPIVYNKQLSGFLLFGQVEIEGLTASEFPSIQPINTNWKADPELRYAREKIHIVSQNKLKSAATLLKKINDFHSNDDDPRKRIAFNVKSSDKQAVKQKVNRSDEIKRSIAYIQRNINRAITLEEVSDHVFLSQYYFSRLFKKEMGVNFVTYLNRQRIERAKMLLMDSSLSIDAISHNLGFSQTSYFCKLFKMLTQTTPAKYRKKSDIIR